MARREVTIKAVKATMPVGYAVPKPKVPPLSELVARLIRINRNYKVVYEKEFAEWCNRYVGYLAAVGKDQPGFKDWHNRASKMAREAVEGPPPPPDPEIQLAYDCGYETGMRKSGHWCNPYDNPFYAVHWRTGWTDAKWHKGEITRVN